MSKYILMPAGLINPLWVQFKVVRFDILAKEGAIAASQLLWVLKSAAKCSLMQEVQLPATTWESQKKWQRYSHRAKTKKSKPKCIADVNAEMELNVKLKLSWNAAKWIVLALVWLWLFAVLARLASWFWALTLGCPNCLDRLPTPKVKKKSLGWPFNCAITAQRAISTLVYHFKWEPHMLNEQQYDLQRWIITKFCCSWFVRIFLYRYFFFFLPWLPFFCLA